jgi:hypothetical protein
MRSFMLVDFGQVYPLARGTAVAVVAVLATVAVGEAMPAIRLVGVILVCVRPGRARRTARPDRGGRACRRWWPRSAPA